jgi:hypothetical protein
MTTHVETQLAQLFGVRGQPEGDQAARFTRADDADVLRRCTSAERRAVSESTAEITERFLFQRPEREGLPARVPCSAESSSGASQGLSARSSCDGDDDPNGSVGKWLQWSKDDLTMGEQRLAESQLGLTLRIRNRTYVAF